MVGLVSAKKITLTRYECKCDLKDCAGKGEPWISKDEGIPERCTWCGRRTWNGKDKRKNLLITVNGKTLRLSEWAKESGLSAQVIHHRLKVGWTDEQAVTIPAGGHK
jgi:hypothetical protein